MEPFLSKIWNIEKPGIIEVPPPGSLEWINIGFLTERPKSDFTDTGVIGIGFLTSLIDQHDFYFFTKKAFLAHKIVFATGLMTHVVLAFFRLMGWSLSVSRVPSCLPQTYCRLSNFLFSDPDNTPANLDIAITKLNKLLQLYLGILLRFWEKGVAYKDHQDLLEKTRHIFEETLIKFTDIKLR